MTIIITDHHHPRTMQSSWSWQSVYDAIIIIRVRCNHHHLRTMRSSWWWTSLSSSLSWRSSSSMYDAIFIIHVRCDHHHNDFWVNCFEFLWSFWISWWNCLGFYVIFWDFLCEMFWISLWPWDERLNFWRLPLWTAKSCLLVMDCRIKLARAKQVSYLITSTDAELRI